MNAPVSTQLRAIGYIRVSTPEQAREGESLKTQQEAITAFAKHEGYQLLGSEKDEGISGKSMDARPGLQAVLEQVRRKACDVVIVQRMSRLARNARDLPNLSDEFRQRDVALITLKERIDFSTSYGRAMFAMLSAIAELERDIIEEQMTENRQARWRAGRCFVGKVPFGYRWNKGETKLEVDEREKEVYLQIIDLYLNRGMGYKAVCHHLRQQGTRCRRADFSPGVLSGILNNPIYYGHYVVNKHVVKGNTRQKELKPPSEHITFPAPAIIDRATWDRVVERRDFNRVKSKRVTEASPYWLRDRLICTECGSRLKPDSPNRNRRKDGTVSRRYHCYWKVATSMDIELSGRHRCNLPVIQADLLEEHVLFAILYRLGIGGRVKTPAGITRIDPKLFALFDGRRQRQRLQELTAGVQKAQEQLETKKRSRERIFSMIDQDRFDTDELHRRLHQNREQVLALEGRSAQLEAEIAASENEREGDSLLQQFLKDKPKAMANVQEAIFRMQPENKKALFDTLLEGDIEIAVDEESDEKWQIVRIPLVFKPEAFERFLLN